MEPELFEAELTADAMPDVALTVAELAQQIGAGRGQRPDFERCAGTRRNFQLERSLLRPLLFHAQR